MRSVLKVCTVNAWNEVVVIRTYKHGAKNKGQQGAYNSWRCRARKMATCPVWGLQLQKISTLEKWYLLHTCLAHNKPWTQHTTFTLTGGDHTANRLLLLGGGFLHWACPTLAWKVLRGALSFAFLVGFFGGVSYELSPSSCDASCFFVGVGLGLSAPPPPYALPCRHCLIRAYPSPQHRHPTSGHQLESSP